MKKIFIGVLKALGYFALYFGMQTLVSVAIALYGGASIITRYLVAGLDFRDPAVMNRYFEEMIQIILGSAMPTVIVSGILTIGVICMIFKLRKKKIAKELCLRKFSGGAVIPVVLMGLSFNVLTGVFLSLIPIPEELMAAYESSSSLVIADSFAVTFIGTVLVAPVVEEIIFRGLAYTRMKQGMPAMVAMVLSSALFGVAHGQLLWMLYTFVFGLVLIWVFERTGSLFSCILLHAGYNLCAMLLSLLPEETPDVVGVLLILASVVVAAVSVVWFRKFPKASMTVAEAVGERSMKERPGENQGENPEEDKFW